MELQDIEMRLGSARPSMEELRGCLESDAYFGAIMNILSDGLPKLGLLSAHGVTSGQKAHARSGNF